MPAKRGREGGPPDEDADKRPRQAVGPSDATPGDALEALRAKRQAKLSCEQAAAAESSSALSERAAGKQPAASSVQGGAAASRARAPGGDADESYFDDDEPQQPRPAGATNGVGHTNGVGGSHHGNGAGSSGHAPGESADVAAGEDAAADPLEAYMAHVSSRLYLGKEGDGEERAAQRTSRCVCFENLISPERAAAAADEAHQVRMETGTECSRWGTLLRVHVPSGADAAEGGGPPPGGGLGRVFVEFEAEDAAVECARALDGRLFDGRRVTALYYPLGAFYEGDFTDEGAPLQATSITWDDIVAMNSRPASSWDTMDGEGGGGAASGGGNPYGQSDVEQSDAEEAADKEPPGDDSDQFHAQFMQRMRQQADDAARSREKAAQELMDTGDDAMDALVEEFPDMAEHADVDSDSDSDAEAAKLAEVARAKKKELPRVDHSTVTYLPFRKNFYIEVPEIKRMSDEEVAATRLAMDKLKVRGKRVPKPIKKWTQCGLSDAVLAVIEKSGYAAPFPIQAQALPTIMQGRDVIAIAKTGSGKTMGYTLPMLRHVLDQPPLEKNDGPISLIMVPTRELAMQVYREVNKFARLTQIRVVAVYGGAGIKQQISELRRGAEVVVCTPGRMIDMLTANGGRVTNLQRVTYVVLDEADRMFDLGFAPQIDRIVGNTRPDRQTCLFSATFPTAVEKLARGVLTKPVQIVAGGISVVSDTIEQHIEVLTAERKLPRLCELLRRHYDEGQILVFVDTQEACDILFRELLKQQLPCTVLHGGMGQDDRDSTISDFKLGNISMLIATSVAARGLDVKDLVCVINYEVPNHYEDYVHRVGRTGRAGALGVAYTFITPDEEKYAPDLVKAMEAAGQEPPDDVMCMANAYNSKRKAGELAAKDFRTSGFKSGRGVALDSDSILKEQRKKKSAHLLARAAAGVEGDGGASSSDEDDKAGGGSGSGGAGPSGADSGSLVDAAAKAARALQTQLGSSGASSQLGTSAASLKVQSELLKAAAKAGAGAAAASASGAAAPSAAPLPPPTNPRLANLPEATQRAIAAATAKAQLAANKFALPGAAGASAAPTLMAPLMPQRHVSELEINDYPQTARFKVTSRETIQGIEEWTKAAVITKGTYYPPGRNAPPGERKLYLHIEAETHEAMKAARKELKRVLQEQSVFSAPDDSSTNRYAKYSV